MKHTLIFIGIAAIGYIIISSISKAGVSLNGDGYRCLAGKNTLYCITGGDEDHELGN